MKRLRRSGRVAVLTVVIIGALGGAASAYFTATGAGTTSADVGTLDPPSKVEATPTGGGATVRITRNASAAISPESYDLERNTDAKAAPAPACKINTKTLTTTCKDLGAPAGTYTYTVVARYRSFSASADSNPVTVVKDVKQRVTLTSPPDGSATAAATISGTAGDATGDSSTVKAKIYHGTGTTGTVSQSLDVTRSGASWSTGAATLAQGTYTVQATQTDTAGNIDTSAANTFIVDTSAPAVTLTSPADPSPMAATTPTISGAAGNAPGDSSTVTVKIYDGTGAIGTAGKTLEVKRSGASWSTSATTLAQGAYTVQATQTDTAGNVGTSAANTFVLDTSAPALSTLQMFDRDANGRVDEVKATFSEPLATSDATKPWTLTDVPSDGTLSAVSTSGSDATLTIKEGSGAADTSVGSFKIALAANASAIRDPAGNQARFAATAPSDLARPALSTLHMLDGDANGAVDEVEATFTEPLALWASDATEPWTLTDVPSDGTLSAVSASGSDATLTIKEGSGAADTSVGSFKIALAANASAIRDWAGNEASFDATTPSDLAGPVLMIATSDGGTITDLMQPGDTLALTFSEALAPGSVPDRPDVTESRSSTGTLTIAGLITPASIDLGYLDESADSATSGTTSALTDDTVTVTLDALNTDASVAAGSGGASILPAASLKDPAGNAAASAAPATARLVTPLF